MHKSKLTNLVNQGPPMLCTERVDCAEKYQQHSGNG